MKICVTGALGHIGSALIRSLTVPNLEAVHLVDNMYKQRYVSLMDLPKAPYVFHGLDINSREMDKVIAESDVVVHLAAISDAESSLDQKDLVEKTNIEGLRNIVKLCGKYKVKLLFPSTTSVYSAVGKELDEECEKRYLVPQNPYADSKLRGEELIKDYGKKLSFDYVIFRIGTIYGFSVGMRFNTAVNKFILQAVSGQKITVWKTAMEQRRPYCDLVDGVRAINFFINNSFFNRQIYNIVTDNLTVAQIILVINEHMPDLEVSKIDSRIMNTLSYGVSNEKSKAKGFAYRGDLQRSVKEAIRHLAGVNYLVKKK